jgi:hypothetical protein
MSMFTFLFLCKGIAYLAFACLCWAATAWLARRL